MISNLRFSRLSLYSVLFPFLWGCIEHTITTQIMPDGRVIRTISLKGDSTAIFLGTFPVPEDSGWAVTTRHEKQDGSDSIKRDEFVYEAVREFPDYKAVNLCFYRDTIFSDHINIKVELQKKSRWFYTYYTYTETYLKLFPFRSVPVHDILNDRDLRIFLAGENEVYYSPQGDSLMVVTDSVTLPVLSQTDSLRFKQLMDTLEQKFEKWQKVNIYNDLFDLVCDALGKMGKLPDTVNTRVAFYQYLDSTRVFESALENRKVIVDEAASFFNVDPEYLEAANLDGFNLFDKKFRISALSLESFVNQVLMPGMILHANTTENKGNLVVWRFRMASFYATDYSMKVNSRIINKMALVLTSLIVLGTTGIVLILLFMKKKPRPDRG